MDGVDGLFVFVSAEDFVLTAQPIDRNNSPQVAHMVILCFTVVSSIKGNERSLTSFGCSLKDVVSQRADDL